MGLRLQEMNLAPKVTNDNRGKKVKEEWFNSRGELHRDDGPAEVMYHRNGKLMRQVWYQNGEVSRIGGPAFIEYRGDGVRVNIERWLQNGVSHRVDGPAEIIYYGEADGGGRKIERWSTNGRFFRVGGPVQIDYTPQGTVHYEEWREDIDNQKSKRIYFFPNGRMSSISIVGYGPEQPTDISYNEDGIKISETWSFQYYTLHNYYDLNGVITKKEWLWLRPVIVKLSITYYSNGEKKEERRLFNNEGDEEATQYNENGAKISQEWLHRNRQFQMLLHKNDGPARMLFYENGHPRSEEWMLNGRLHREDGPAITKFDENGVIREQCWYNDGELENQRLFDENGNEQIAILSFEDEVVNEDEVVSEEKESSPMEEEIKDVSGFLRSKCTQGAEDIITGEPLEFDDDNDVVFIFDEKLKTAECIKREEMRAIFEESKVTLWPPQINNNGDVKLAKLPFTGIWVRNVEFLLKKRDIHCFYVVNRKPLKIGSEFGVSQLHGAEELVGTIKPAPRNNDMIRQLERHMRK